MVYHAKAKRFTFIFFFLILLNAVKEDSGISFYFVVLTFLILFMAILQFTIKINDHIEYRILFFKICIYKRDIYPGQILQMKFKRTGWSEKMTAIQLRKGLGIRIIDFEPKTIYDELIRFADVHDISISKSKDYLILEKMSRNRRKGFSG